MATNFDPTKYGATPVSQNTGFDPAKFGAVKVQAEPNIYEKLVSAGKTVGNILGGNILGENIGTLAGYGLTAGKEALGLAPKGSTQAYDLSTASAGQTVGDLLKVGTSVIPTTGIGTLATKIASKVPLVSRVAKGVGSIVEGGAMGYSNDVGTAIVDKKENPLDIGAGTVIGASATPALKVINTVIGKPAKAIYQQFNPDAVEAITKAIKPTGKQAKNFKSTAEDVLPILSTFEKENGTKISDIDSLITATKEIRKGVWDSFETKLKNTNTMIDGNLIADEILKSISERTKLQNPALAQRITDTANSYRGFLKPQQAEDFLQEANAELQSFYTKDPSAKANALKNPNTAYLVKEAEGLREGLYKAIDSINDSNVAKEKSLYGKLATFQDLAEKRAIIAGRQSPFNLAEQLTVPDAITSAGASVATGSLIPAIMGLGKVGLVRLLKEANSSDALIVKSLKKYQQMSEPQRINFINKVSDKIGNKQDLVEKLLKYPAFQKVFYAENSQ